MIYEKNAIYFFLDEGKGGLEGNHDNPYSVVIRSFDPLNDLFFNGFIDYLIGKKAYTWHASERVGLSVSSFFEEAYKNINQLKSFRFIYNRFEDRCERELDRWSFVKDSSKESLCWDLNSKFQKFLLFCIKQTSYAYFLHPSNQFCSPKKLVYIVDEMSFLQGKRGLPEEDNYGLIPLTSFRLSNICVTINMKTTQSNQEVKALLGLVDAECWLWARFCKFKPTSNISLDKEGYKNKDDGDYPTILHDVLEGLNKKLEKNFEQISHNTKAFFEDIRAHWINNLVAFNGLFKTSSEMEKLKLKDYPKCSDYPNWVFCSDKDFQTLRSP